MRRRLPPWLLLLILLAVCAGILAGIASWRRGRYSTAHLIERLPGGNRMVLCIDFAALRRAGVLDAVAGSDMVQEPEYRAFIEQTGFDYARDLDSALVAFNPRGTFFLLRGRFNWQLLKEYVLQNHGECYNSFCQTQGSTPERMISYFPLDRDLMALAVSKDPTAASQLQERGPGLPIALPDRPVWAYISNAALRDQAQLPSGTRAFARAMQHAERIVITLGQERGGLELKLNVRCGSPADAASLAAQLRQATNMLNDLVRKEGEQPNPRDLSGILTAGFFEQHDREVEGRWPVPRAFVDAVLAGGNL